MKKKLIKIVARNDKCFAKYCKCSINFLKIGCLNFFATLVYEFSFFLNKLKTHS